MLFRSESETVTPRDARNAVASAPRLGGVVVLVVVEIRLHRRHAVPEVRFHCRHVGPVLRVRELRDGDGGKDADDHDHDQQLNEGETVALIIIISIRTVERRPLWPP